MCNVQPCLQAAQLPGHARLAPRLPEPSASLLSPPVWLAPHLTRPEVRDPFALRFLRPLCVSAPLPSVGRFLLSRPQPSASPPIICTNLREASFLCLGA
jgi:hypothetical protein